MLIWCQTAGENPTHFLMMGRLFPFLPLPPPLFLSLPLFFFLPSYGRFPHDGTTKKLRFSTPGAKCSTDAKSGFEKKSESKTNVFRSKIEVKELEKCCPFVFNKL